MTSLELHQIEQAADMLKAMAHPMRLKIIDMLRNSQQALTVTEIYQTLDIEQAVASHHLSILKNKGIVIVSREGKNSCYSLKFETISAILDCIGKCIS